MLKISLLGHRKRIIASLAERPYEEPPVKPPRLSQIRVRTVFFFKLLFPLILERGRVTPSSNSSGSAPLSSHLSFASLCLSSVTTCPLPSPRLPSARWNPAQDALWNPCCPSESPGGRKSPMLNLRFPRKPKASDTDQVYVSQQQSSTFQGGCGHC